MAMSIVLLLGSRFLIKSACRSEVKTGSMNNMVLDLTDIMWVGDYNRTSQTVALHIVQGFQQSIRFVLIPFKDFCKKTINKL